MHDVFALTAHVRANTNIKHAKSLCSHVRRTQYPNPNIGFKHEVQHPAQLHVQHVRTLNERRRSKKEWKNLVFIPSATNRSCESAKRIDRYSTAEKVRRIVFPSSDFFLFVRRVRGVLCEVLHMKFMFVYMFANSCLPKNLVFERLKTCKHEQTSCSWEDWFKLLCVRHCRWQCKEDNPWLPSCLSVEGYRERNEKNIFLFLKTVPCFECVCVFGLWVCLFKNPIGRSIC